MAVSFKNLISSKYIENSQTTQYTAIGLVAIIDKFSIVNVTSSNASISINIVKEGNSVSDSNLILDNKTIRAGETYLVPEAIGQILNSGSFISTLASSSSTLSMRVSGREIT